MKRILSIVLICMVVLAGFGCSKTQAQMEMTGEAQDFELIDINGNPVKLSDFKGKIIILNFFATWCPPCRMEMPDFNEIYKMHQKDVEILAINVGGEPLPKIKQFAATNNLVFPVLMDDGGVSNMYGPIRAIPVSIIIDKEFNIVKRYLGARPKEIFIQDIEDLREAKE